MARTLLSLVALVTAASASAAAPAPLAQGTVTVFSNGAGPGVVAQLSQAAPDGVLIQTQQPAGATDEESCQVPGETSWWYDPTTYPAGAGYEYGAGAGAPSEPGFSSGTSYTLTLPPAPPFSFSGVLPAGAQSCSQSVAFVVADAGTYSLQFTAEGGSMTFYVSPVQLAGQGAKPISVLGSVTITQQLTPGVWSVTFNDGDTGQTSWSISVDSPPPSIVDANASAGLGYPGASASFNLELNQSGILDADVLQGTATVRGLLASEPVAAGRQTIVWDGRLANGSLAPSGTYDLRVSETDSQGRTATQNVPYRVDDGVPTAAELSSIRAAIRQEWCRDVRKTSPSLTAPCGAWVLSVSRIRVDIFGRRYAAASNLLPHLPGRRPDRGGQVLLKRTGSSWAVVEPPNGMSAICAKPPLPAGIMTDLGLCQ